MEEVLVATLEEVIANVKQFNRDVEDQLEIVQQLTQFKHWYCYKIQNYILNSTSSYICVTTIPQNSIPPKQSIDSNQRQ